MTARSAALTALLLSALASSVPAQNTTTLNATITISPSLTVATVRDIDFGTVAQGLPNVLINQPDIDPRAGQVRVTAVPNVPVAFTLQLPSVLDDQAGHTIPIPEWFTAFVAMDQPTLNFTSPPGASILGAIVGSNGMVDAFFGARLAIDVNQFPATYTAQVIVSVFYN